MNLSVVASVVAVLALIGVFDYFLRKYRREHRSEKLEERQKTADAYHEQFQSTDVFPTRNGPVTVTWRPHFDVAREIDRGADPFQLSVVPEEISQREEPRWRPGPAELKLVEEKKAKLAEILTGNPDANLSTYEEPLRIRVLRVERSWVVEEKESSFDADLAVAQSAADADKKYKAFLAANPDLSDFMRKRLKNKFDNRIHDLLNDE